MSIVRRLAVGGWRLFIRYRHPAGKWSGQLFGPPPAFEGGASWHWQDSEADVVRKAIEHLRTIDEEVASELKRKWEEVTKK